MVRMWSDSEDAINRLFRRCLECPTNVTPTCPVCPEGTQCSLQTQTCNSCPNMTCVRTNDIPGQISAKAPTPVGAIIGGVVGGILVLVAILFLFRRYATRKTKSQEAWVPPEKTVAEPSPNDSNNDNIVNVNNDGSTTTTLSRTHSIASTVMTRASNVIQIAYIPGVTVRSDAGSPEIAPPMPSIPAAYVHHSANTTPDIEQHFFMPKDLRDSVWSDTSSMMTDPRISIAPSLARTTMYEGNVDVPPIPAQYAYVAQASAVSVRSGGNTPNIGQSGTSSPPLPKAINISNSSIVARNVVAKPIELKKTGSTSSGPTFGASLVKKSASRRATPAPTISDEKEVVVSSPSSTIASETPILRAGGRLGQSSFTSPQGISVSGLTATTPADGPLGSTSAQSGRPTTAYAEAMIHEAMFRATQDSTTSTPSIPSVPSLTIPKPDLKRHDSGPFSDTNEIN